MTSITYREAITSDIPGMQIVRNAVKENVLSNPDLITNDDYIPFITTRGKGWVCEMNLQIVGFAIADLQEQNIWALFILPEYSGRGIGKALQKRMLDWYFNTGTDYVWLGTSPDTRAERFYALTGWVANGDHGDEVKFEMTKSHWISLQT